MKRTRISESKRNKVMAKLLSGESVAKLSKEYGMSTSNLYLLKQKAKKNDAPFYEDLKPSPIKIKINDEGKVAALVPAPPNVVPDSTLDLVNALTEILTNFGDGHETAYYALKNWYARES